MYGDLCAKGAKLQGSVEAAVDACGFDFFGVGFGEGATAIGPELDVSKWEASKIEDE